MAFVDRADIKQYIGPPSSTAIYKIYLSCLNELMRVSQQLSSSAPLVMEPDSFLQPVSRCRYTKSR